MSNGSNFSITYFISIMYLFLSLSGCSSHQLKSTGPFTDFKIDIKGNHSIQVAGEYTLDGETNAISGSLPIELTKNGNRIEFNLHRVKGDGPIGVDIYIDGNKSCTCSTTSPKAYIEGGANDSMSWIKSK